MGTFEDKKVDTSRLKNYLKEESNMDPKKKATNPNANTPEDNANEMANLLNEANQQFESSTPATDTTGTTSEFSSDEVKNAANASEAEKAAAKAKRNADAQKNNDFVDRQTNLLVIPGVGSFSPAQKLYRAYCAKYMRVIGLIYEKGPKVNLTVGSSFVKNDKKFVREEGVVLSAQEEAALQKSESASAELKNKAYKKEAKIKYNMSGPKNLVGAVISMPEVLNITQAELNSDDYKAPTPDAVKNSNRITVAVSTELFFYYAFTCCGAKILEDRELFKENPYYQKHTQDGEIEAFIRIVEGSKKSGTEGVGPAKRVPTFRFQKRGLAIQENTIPIKVYKTKDAATLDASEVDALSTKIRSAFDKTPTGKTKTTQYDILQRSFKEKIAKNADGSYDVSFIQDPKKLGELGLSVNDWGKKNWDGSKVLAITMPNFPMPVLTTGYTKDGKIKIVDVISELGVDGYALSNLASEGFTAAANATANGITDEAILNVYKKYKSTKSAQRTTKSETITKKSKNLMTEEVQRSFYMNTLNSAVNTNFTDINFAELNSELLDNTI